MSGRASAGTVRVGADDRRGRKRPKRSVRPAVRKKGLLERIRDRESLAGADLRFLWLIHWDLSNLDLRNANLRGTRLVGADLSGCDLRGASLEGAHLNEACFRGAKLENASLREAIVQAADFRACTGLTRTAQQVLQARGAIF